MLSTLPFPTAPTVSAVAAAPPAPHATPSQFAIHESLATTVASAVVDSDLPLPRSELDSYENMTVLGQHCFVFDNIHGQTCKVQPFDPSLGTVMKCQLLMLQLLMTLHHVSHQSNVSHLIKRQRTIILGDITNTTDYINQYLYIFLK